MCLSPFRFETIRRNELGSKIPEKSVKTAMKRGTTHGLRVLIEKDRQQRAATVLRDVAYVIDAHFALTGNEEDADRTAAKHIAIFNRRAGRGQCFHRPCLGVREFAAHFALVDGAGPQSGLPEDQRDRDLGWMLHDIDYEEGNSARFFRAELRGGVIEVPPLHAPEVKR